MRLTPNANINARRAESGYTLVEVIMGSVVILIMGIGLLGGMTSGNSFTQLARQDLRATQIMLEKMEEIRLYSWSQINSNGYIPTNFAASYYPPGLSSNAGGIVYTGKLSILTVDPANFPCATYTNGMRLINVNLQWKCGNVVRSRYMNTYVASNGIQNYVYNNGVYTYGP